MKKLYKESPSSNDPNALAPTFLELGYRIHKLRVAAQTGCALSSNEINHLVEAVSELGSYAAIESKAKDAYHGIRRRLAVIDASDWGSHTTGQQVEDLWAVSHNSCRVQSPYETSPERAWFIAGVQIAIFEALLEDRPGKEALALIRLLRQHLQAGWFPVDARELVAVVVASGPSACEETLVRLRGRAGVLWALPDKNDHQYRFNGHPVTEVEYSVMEVARLHAYGDGKNLSSAKLVELTNHPSASHALKKLRGYPHTSKFLNQHGRVIFVKEAPRPPRRRHQ